MAVDDDLADRLRDELAPQAGVTEKRMFGGLAFLLDGNMAVCVSGEGGLMVRVEPDDTDRLVETTAAGPMEMKGRVLAGWVRVPVADLGDDAELARWVGLGVARARTFPPK